MGRGTATLTAALGADAGGGRIRREPQPRVDLAWFTESKTAVAKLAKRVRDRVAAARDAEAKARDELIKKQHDVFDRYRALGGDRHPEARGELRSHRRAHNVRVREILNAAVDELAEPLAELYATRVAGIDRAMAAHYTPRSLLARAAAEDAPRTAGLADLVGRSGFAELARFAQQAIDVGDRPLAFAVASELEKRAAKGDAVPLAPGELVDLLRFDDARAVRAIAEEALTAARDALADLRGLLVDPGARAGTKTLAAGIVLDGLLAARPGERGRALLDELGAVVTPEPGSLRDLNDDDAGAAELADARRAEAAASGPGRIAAVMAAAAQRNDNPKEG